jgi:AN1-type zinc finger protein 5/6
MSDKPRCFTCKKKLGLLGFNCRCGGTYCSAHRADVEHKCTFDYSAEQKERLSSVMIKVIAKKIEAI